MPDLFSRCQRGVRAVHLEVERSGRDLQRWYRLAGFHDHDRVLMTMHLHDA